MSGSATQEKVYRMVGICSFGAYVPMLRLPFSTISGGGRKAAAGGSGENEPQTGADLRYTNHRDLRHARSVSRWGVDSSSVADLASVELQLVQREEFDRLPVEIRQRHVVVHRIRRRRFAHLA